MSELFEGRIPLNDLTAIASRMGKEVFEGYNAALHNLADFYPDLQIRWESATVGPVEPYPATPGVLCATIFFTVEEDEGDYWDHMFADEFLAAVRLASKDLTGQ